MKFEQAYINWYYYYGPHSSDDDDIDELIKDTFALESIWIAGCFISYAEDQKVQDIDSTAIEILDEVRRRAATLLIEKPAEEYSTIVAIQDRITVIDTILQAYMDASGAKIVKAT